MRDGDILHGASTLGVTYSRLPFGPSSLISCPSGLVATEMEPFNLSVSPCQFPKHASSGLVDVLSHNKDVYGPSHVAHPLSTTPYHNLLPHSIFNSYKNKDR